MAFLSKIFGDANKRHIDSLEPVIERINSLEPELEKMSDADLKGKTSEFKTRLKAGETLDDLLPEAFAAVREASKRTLGQRHFNVQLMGGIALHQGRIAEMRTGEGKTLVATLPTYLNALSGQGVHVVTVNDYLARRDAVWMGQIYYALGLSVGCINHDSSFIYDPLHTSKPEDAERDQKGGFKIVHEFLRPIERREAYAADITYGTNNEYGFDYLRDNMAFSLEQMVQREHAFAIVDEVDSILIDEARTPLIISAPDTESTNLYDTFSKTVPFLVNEQDYSVDEKLKTVSITESGIEKVEKRLNLDNIYAEGGMRYVHHLEQALRAEVLFKRDRDYVVKDGQILIVDEFTGRLMPGRRWSEGLHQAIEAKEGVKVERESRTYATITFQNYFRLYSKLSGMTGTAQTSAEEFHKVYKLEVVTIPTNKTMARQDLPDRIYKTELGKFRAIANEVKDRHDKGQPLLIGTVSIEKNELLAAILEREGIKHNVLNAKNHEREAEIIAQAGRLGAVTVATNMAGRGVDIILGGNPASLEEAAKVREAGGLHVIGTERHEARRTDDQLRGRAGRQGDPGSSQFFISTEDDLARIFGGDRLKSIMDRLGVGDDDVIENRFVSSSIREAQSRVEGHNFDIRKYVLEFDDVMNKHRETVYKLRREVLASDNVKEKIWEYLDEWLDGLLAAHANPDSPDWNSEEIAEAFRALTGLPAEASAKAGAADSIHAEIADMAAKHEAENLRNLLFDKLTKLYESKESASGAESMRSLEKIVMLRTIDELWVDHIEAMEYLRDSVRLRAYGQRDPLVEYKIEGQKMYDELLQGIKAQIANTIFKVSFMNQPRKVKLEEKRQDIETGRSEIADDKSHFHASKENETGLSADGSTKVGRNDPCPCGAINPATGQVYKWKKCGMINAPHHKQS